MKRDTRITVFVAILTFLGLTGLTAGVWAFTREEPSASEFERIEIDELKTLFDAGNVTIIDTRDADAYIASHIPGALHIPLARIEGEIEHLPKGRLVVTYCSCPAEETSGAAALILQHSGIEARALRGGYEQWLSRKYASASGVK